MGLFDRFKKKENQPQPDPSMKMVPVDGIYIIDVPKDWTEFKSDRFRMTNADESVNLSVSNYAREVAKNYVFTLEDLKNQTLPLFDKFVNEGGYERIGQVEIGKNFVYQAFKVDEETQYYYYTHRIVRSTQFVFTGFILREDGAYKSETGELLKKVGNSIKHKLADL